ncbi:hypothetical protein [Marinobacter caseinilyticus]|uniref:hypothetical protein n=1 Tax=Marinobacter caseinilyticus TaxID=2692195 RepID=UPI001A941A89|nr:hypothetical protein [Marinobacter caseinilyticus]
MNADTDTATADTKQQPTKRKTQATKAKRPTRKAAASTREQRTDSPVRQWLKLSREELDSLYQKAKPGSIPQGDTRGTAILAGGPLPRVFAGLARLLAWQGKVFDLFSPGYSNGVVVNKITPLGLNLIVAKTYRDQSWMDGKETIVIDYRSTSLLARKIRDEIREVEPGVYLGKVWWGKRRILDFALETPIPANA